MVVVKFRTKEEHSDIVKKVRKMRKFAEELEDCLDDVMEDEDAMYREDYDDDEMRPHMRRGGGSSRYSRMR